MKTKNNLLVGLVLSLLSLHSFVAHSQDTGLSGSVIGGGVGVDDGNGNIILLEEANPNIFNKTLSGDEMIQSRTETQNILTKLESVNWYVAFQIKRSIQNLMFNFTNNRLFPPKVTDKAYSDIMIYTIPQSPLYVVGVRPLTGPLVGQIFVNEPNYNKLLPVSAGLFPIHEALHEYFSLSDPFRNTYLQTVSDQIKQIGNGASVSLEFFNKILKNNRADFGNTSIRLQANEKRFLEFFFSTVDSQRAQILAGTVRLSDFFDNLRPQFVEALNPKDRDAISSTLKHLDTALFGNYCLNRDVDVLKKLASLPKPTSFPFSVTAICMQYDEVLMDKTFMQSIYDANDINVVLDQFLKDLNTVKITNKDSRIMVSGAINLLLSNPLPPQTRRILLQTELLDQFNFGQADSRTRTLVYFLGSLARSRANENWFDDLTNNPNFVRAFKAQDKISAIESLGNDILAREKTAAIEYVPYIYKTFLETLIRQVAQLQQRSDETTIDPSDFDFSPWLEKVNKLNLGYKVEIK